MLVYEYVNCNFEQWLHAYVGLFSRLTSDIRSSSVDIYKEEKKGVYWMGANGHIVET